MPESDLKPRPDRLPRIGAGLPLQGVTLLLVEDSRFAADGLRLMALRCGLRLRRAETLAEARRHLSLYRPDLVLVDLGLPDGAGEDLIAELSGAPGPVVLAMSGDPGREAAARAAGALAFWAKPITGCAAFLDGLLAHLPAVRGSALRDLSPPRPDLLALREDFLFARALLDRSPGWADYHYLSGFLSGLARATADQGLAAAAEALPHSPGGAAAAQLSGLLAQRLADLPAAFATPACSL